MFAPPQSRHTCNHATRRAHTYIVIAARGRFSRVTLHKCTAYRPPTFPPSLLSVVQISKSNRREERRGYSVASYAIGRTAATEMLVVCPMDPPARHNDMTMPRKKSSLFNFHSALLLLLSLSRPHSSFCRLITAPKTMKKARPYTNNILLARKH